MKAGDVLADRYRLEARLVRGGMGDIWEGTDQTLRRQVAVKMVRPDIPADPVVLGPLRHEAVITAGSQHPEPLVVDDVVVSTEGLLFIVMELARTARIRAVSPPCRRASLD